LRHSALFFQGHEDHVEELCIKSLAATSTQRPGLKNAARHHRNLLSSAVQGAITLRNLALLTIFVASTRYDHNVFEYFSHAQEPFLFDFCDAVSQRGPKSCS
jgi:hypothetical protein